MKKVVNSLLAVAVASSLLKFAYGLSDFAV